jgi:hypothetical protein
MTILQILKKSPNATKNVTFGDHFCAYLCSLPVLLQQDAETKAANHTSAGMF